MKREATELCCQVFSLPGCVVLTIALLLPAAGLAQDWRVDWHTIDGGGEILSETTDQQWQLSGTLGQWDSTESQALAGSDWTLTGGFWPIPVIERTDALFQDRFEAISMPLLWHRHGNERE